MKAGQQRMPSISGIGCRQSWVEERNLRRIACLSVMRAAVLMRRWRHRRRTVKSDGGALRRNPTWIQRFEDGHINVMGGRGTCRLKPSVGGCSSSASGRTVVVHCISLLSLQRLACAIRTAASSVYSTGCRHTHSTARAMVPACCAESMHAGVAHWDLYGTHI